MRKLLVALGLLFACHAAHAQTYKPDFDCNKPPPNNGVAIMLCQNSEAAKQELIFDQTYYALRQKVGPEGWKSLKQEIVLAENAMNQQCGLPIPGEANQAIPDQGAACYIEGMGKLTEQYKQRLSGSALEEATRDIDRHIALQQKLIDLGYLPSGAVADGVYGEGTRTAIETWQRTKGRPETDGFLSDNDSDILLSPPSIDAGTPTTSATENVSNSYSSQNGPLRGEEAKPTIEPNEASKKSDLLQLAEKHGVADSIRGISPTVVLLILLSLISFYFLPLVVALCRSSSKTIPIFIVNFFLGWTFLGWIVALVMAFSSETKTEYHLRMAAMKRMADI
ncbi:superinfection immunity protein [Acetobacter sicerae]|uniref:superinfection immunity protein n=1 Tax=Acetobacter sicerae TaxID=85325 RepID=UPI00156BB63F|nr:superinfection immunity protein [Acetobacter sicerae]NHN93448.1 superinfection immunity protein [Acetobacter sicerae]